MQSPTLNIQRNPGVFRIGSGTDMSSNHNKIWLESRFDLVVEDLEPVTI